MNPPIKNFDPQLKGNLPAHFINERFINFSYWAHPWTGKFNLNHGSGFNSTTIYLRKASFNPVPVLVSHKTGVRLKNDYEGPLQSFSLHSVNNNEKVFSLTILPSKETIQLGFVRNGHYRLSYKLMSSDQKELSVDIVVR